jgi:hypothetical protein
MLHDLDAELLNLLNSVLMLQSGPAELSNRGSSAAGAPPRLLQRAPSFVPTVSGVATGSAAAARAAELEAYVQDKCSEMATSIAAHLRAQLNQFQVLPEGAAGAADAEQVLLLGRLCSGLASDSKYLPVLLGAPEVWKAAAAAVGGDSVQGTGGGRLRHSLGRQAAPSSHRAQQAMEVFLSISLSAFR